MIRLASILLLLALAGCATALPRCVGFEAHVFNAGGQDWIVFNQQNLILFTRRAIEAARGECEIAEQP